MLRFTTALCTLAACVVALTFLVLVQLESVLIGFGSIHAPAFFCVAMLMLLPVASKGARYLSRN